MRIGGRYIKIDVLILSVKIELSEGLGPVAPVVCNSELVLVQTSLGIKSKCMNL